MSDELRDDRTFVLLKPDAVSRGLTGKILDRYETKGLKIVALKHQLVDDALAAAHYEEHHGRPYYPTLMQFITSGPVVALVLEGERAIEIVRILNGSTDAGLAAPGTIRGDFSLFYQRNIVHASDSPENAAREIALWFGEI